jgi:hypothetical protein
MFPLTYVGEQHAFILIMNLDYICFSLSNSLVMILFPVSVTSVDFYILFYKGKQIELFYKEKQVNSNTII